MVKITAIICAYNEERTIRGVLVSVLKSGLFHEVVVVDDGSTDRTREIIQNLKRDYQFVDIHLSENRGKGYALATGIEASTSELLVFLDADLIGLRKSHFKQLIIPVLYDEADMVLGQHIHEPNLINEIVYYSLNPFVPIVGQRALWKRDILPILDRIRDSRYGVETIINLHYLGNCKRIKVVKLLGVKHFKKFEKSEKSRALIQYFNAANHIVEATVRNKDLVALIFENRVRPSIKKVRINKQYGEEL